jgi:hypothetical protein
VLGHVNIWSSTAHPDRLFTIENIDRDDNPGAGGSTSHHDTSAVLRTEDGFGVAASNRANGPLASDKDRMIELRYKL